MATLNDHAQESESRFSCLSAANPENIPDVRKGKIKSQYTTKARKSNKPWPPARRAGRGLAILFDELIYGRSLIEI